MTEEPTPPTPPGGFTLSDIRQWHRDQASAAAYYDGEADDFHIAADNLISEAILAIAPGVDPIEASDAVVEAMCRAFRNTLIGSDGAWDTLVEHSLTMAYEYREGMRAALSASRARDRADAPHEPLPPAPTNKLGEWVTVPREPTEAMTNAAWDAHEAYERASPPAVWLGPASIYRAMIAAAPLNPADLRGEG